MLADPGQGAAALQRRLPLSAALCLVLLVYGGGLGSRLLLAQGPRTISHVLAWEYAGSTPTFVVDQCQNQAHRCVMEAVATVPGTVATVELGGLRPQWSYCWQVRLPTGQASNIVCSD